MSTPVRSFYDQLQFPGYYTYGLLSEYDADIQNPYLRAIDRQLGDDLCILDAGCGTGLTTNLFAMRHPTSRFTGIDFANSIDFAKSFAKANKITNVRYIKQDLINVEFDQLYDVVICQGVLHHIPEYKIVIQKLMSAVAPGGKLILGLYHPAGKILKHWVNLDYESPILETDQEINPFELAFTAKQVKNLVPGFQLLTATPRLLNNVTIPALFNSKNGGLVTYTFRKLL